MVSDLEARLQKIIANQLGVDEDKVQPSAAFIADLKADSLDLAELMMSLEDEFKVVISEDDAATIKTVGDAIAYIRDHLG
ncbi:MAG: acyl carrier protein [Chloroflexaceae bacterium]|jgi:acyl carrier protein|nr:acyl carrier protein [Chloroflexaceae bacterium]